MNRSLQSETERQAAKTLRDTLLRFRHEVSSAFDASRRAFKFFRSSAARSLSALSRPAPGTEGATVGESASLLRILLAHVWNRLSADDTPPLIYGLVLVVFTISFLISLALKGVLPQSLDLLFFASVVICAGIGGIRAGLLVTALSLVSTVLFFRTPRLSADHLILSSVLFTLVALLTSIVCDGLTIARRQAENALAQAEGNGRRSLLLAEASAFLDASVDFRSTLENVTRLAVPRFADWCTIDLAPSEEEGTPLLILAHRDRKKEEALRQMRGNYPLDLGSNHAIASVMRTGKPELIAEITDEILIGAAHNPTHLKALLDLNPQSAICVPLISRGRTIGVISYVLTTPNRMYGPLDLMVAKDLAQRVALAIDNAQLYQAAQQEILVRKQAEERILVLNEQLQRAMTETHHRVKNNLQLISAMIDIHLMDNADSYSADDLRRLGSSVRTLAVVHDLLTHEAKKNGQTQVMSTKSVLEKLLTLIATTAGNCRLQFSIEDVSLFSRESASLALITNELVSNAIKHGKGEVRANFAIRNEVAILEVCDDGPGFPAQFDSAQSANIGLDLVENLSSVDLRGKVRYENAENGGGRVVLTMPLPTRDEIAEMVVD